jgi:hypothetical protein
MEPPFPDSWMVEIVTKGPCGTALYSEGSYVASFDWEFGGGDVIAIIYIGPPLEWNLKYPWAADRRNRILERVISEVIRQKAPTCAASIKDESGEILFREHNSRRVAFLVIEPFTENPGGLNRSMQHPLRSAQDLDYSRILTWRAWTRKRGHESA